MRPSDAWKLPAESFLVHSISVEALHVHIAFEIKQKIADHFIDLYIEYRYDIHMILHGSILKEFTLSSWQPLRITIQTGLLW